MSGRTKVAAELVAYVLAKGPGGPRNPMVQHQLRDLLAVAKASRAFRLSHKPVGMNTADFLTPERAGLNNYGSAKEARLHLALCRLYRASAPSPRRKR